MTTITQLLAEKAQNKAELDVELEALKEQYIATIDTLQSHIDEQAWTNAKVISAVVFHARVLLFVVRILRRIVN